MLLSLLAGTVVNAVSLAAVSHGVWWSALSLVAIRGVQRDSSPSPGTEFLVLIPAHNEEAGLPATLRSLANCSYRPAPRIVVVADNCVDETASIARERGAEVIERLDASRRGKGFALDYALAVLRDEDGPVPQVVVFVDADSEVEGGFFDAMSRHFADSRQPAQAYYQAAPGETRLGQLREVAFRLMHWSRSLGACRLGLPTTVKGNGMAICWADVQDGLGASGITEDAEMTLRFVRRGLRFQFVPGAVVTGRMAQSFGDARTQDDRWEGGRFALLPMALRTAGSRLIRGDVRGAASAFEVASLPLSLLVLMSAGAATVAFTTGTGSVGLAFAGMTSIAIYLVLGSVAARLGFREVLAFAEVPRFLVHKLGVYVRLVSRRGPLEWKRTER